MRYPEPRSPARKIRRAIIAVAVLFGTLLTPVVGHTLEPGDSNRDLRVSAADLPALIGILAGQPGNEGADANRDGFVLADDVAATAARIFGRPLAEPTATPTTGVTATATPTSSPTRSVTRPPVTGTATRSPTSSATVETTAVPTATGTVPALPSPTPTQNATATVAAPTGTQSSSPTPTDSPTHTPTSSPTRTSSSTPPVTATLPLATSTPTVTATVTPLATSTSTVTRTATGPSGPLALTRCSDTLAGPLSIPDNNSAGVSNSFVVTDDVPIADLDVQVVITHTFIGDLRVLLTHVPTATSAVLINRAIGGMCREDSMFATFDDQAARFAGFSCSMHDPALGGGLIPDGFLGEFAGESLAGTWRLEVADLARDDQGTLLSWCLKANSTVPVVTSITCDDAAECELGLGEPFVLEFAFTDRDGNASSYRITARDSFGNSFALADDVIKPPAGDGMIAVNFTGFTCDAPPCNDTLFEFFVVVIDADGQESPFASIVINSLGT